MRLKPALRQPSVLLTGSTVNSRMLQPKTSQAATVRSSTGSIASLP